MSPIARFASPLTKRVQYAWHVVWTGWRPPLRGRGAGDPYAHNPVSRSLLEFESTLTPLRPEFCPTLPAASWVLLNLAAARQVG
jgi:hypothetical protein